MTITRQIERFLRPFRFDLEANNQRSDVNQLIRDVVDNKAYSRTLAAASQFNQLHTQHRANERLALKTIGTTVAAVGASLSLWRAAFKDCPPGDQHDGFGCGADIAGIITGAWGGFHLWAQAVEIHQNRTHFTEQSIRLDDELSNSIIDAVAGTNINNIIKRLSIFFL